jgi:hypothetical protein
MRTATLHLAFFGAASQAVYLKNAVKNTIILRKIDKPGHDHQEAASNSFRHLSDVPAAKIRLIF